MLPSSLQTGWITVCAAVLLCAGSDRTQAFAANEARGRLVRMDGSPVQGVRVELYGLKTFARRSSAAALQSMQSGQDGSFRFSGLEDGLYEILFQQRRTAGYDVLGVPHPVRFYVAGGDQLELGSLQYVLKEITCRGRITYKGEACRAGVKVFASAGGGIFTGPAPTIGDGYFSLKLPGWTEAMGLRQRLRILHPDGQSYSRDVEIVPGGLVLVEEQVKFSNCFGTVRVKNGAPLEGVRVIAVPKGERLGYTSPVRTDKDGRFGFTNLPPGGWKIYAFRNPWEIRGREVELKDRMGAEVILEFDEPERSDVAIEIGLTAEGLPLRRIFEELYQNKQAMQCVLEMNKIVLCLIPEGWNFEKECIPPAAAIWSFNSGKLSATLKGVPRGTYRLFLLQGSRAVEDFGLLGGARGRGKVFSAVGWAPPEQGAKRGLVYVDGKTLEVGTSPNKFHIQKDMEVAIILLGSNQSAYPWMRKYIDVLGKKAKGGNR